MLVRHGYGVLAARARGYDGSQGDPNLFGWAGEEDIDAAVAWLAHRPDVTRGRIGGIGFSVGGEMMLQAAASNPRLRAVVSEGAGSRSVREDLLRGPRGWFAPAGGSAADGSRRRHERHGAPSGARRPRTAHRASPHLPNLRRATASTARSSTCDYHRAASGPKVLWKIAEAGHVGGFQARPGEYEQRVSRFFDQALLGKG